VSDPLLAYSIQTRPNPLQAARTGAIDVVVSNMEPENPITLQSIAITLPIGTTSADLAASTAGITTPSPAGWTVKMEGNVCRATPDQPLTIRSQGFVITIATIAVNDQIGKATIYIDERAAYGSQPPALRSTQADVAKFPTAFTLSGLEATPDPIQSGGSTVLMWTGTDFPGLVSYKLSYVTNGAPVEESVPYIGPKTVGNLTNEPQTVFTLRAFVAGAPPVTRQYTIGVLPRAPEIEELSGTFVGEQLVIRWKAKYADYCLISNSSARQETSGSIGPLTPDRLCYTVTAVKSGRSTRRELRLFTQPVASADATLPNVFVAAPDGSLVICGAPSVPAVFDGKTLAARGSVGTGVGFAFGVAFSPDLSRFFVGGHDAATHFANLYSRDLRLLANVDLGVVDSAVYAPDGRSIFVVLVWEQSKILRVDAQSLQTLQTYAYGGHGNSAVCISPDGRTLFVNEDATLVAIDVASGTRLRTLALGMNTGWPSLKYWDGGDKQYLITGWQGRQIKIIDAATFNVVQTLGFFFFFGLTAAEILCAKEWDNTHVYVFDLASLSLKQTLDVPEMWGIWATYGGGAMYTNGQYYQRMTLRRNVAVRAEAGPQQKGTALLQSKRRTYHTLRSESTLVLVSPSGGEDVDAVDVEIDAAAAEAPQGWSVTRHEGGFSFARLTGADDVLTFTFREAKGEPRVRERQ